MKSKLQESLRCFGLPLEVVITAFYVAVTASWVFCWDRVLALFFKNPTSILLWATYEGWLYLIFTAALLFGVLHRIFSGIRRTQKLLGEGEDRFRVLFEQANDGILLLDENLVFIDCNAGACRIFGVSSKAEVMGKTPLDFSPERQEDGQRSAEKATALAAALFTGGSQRFSWKHNQKSGMEVDTDISLSQLELCGQTIIQAIVRDVTERKRAEEKIARFGRVLENSLNEIFIFDAETLRFIDVNRGARKNIGYSMEELREMTPLDIKPEMTPELFKKLIGPLRKGIEEQIQFLTTHHRKDGTQYPVEVHLQLMSHDPAVFVAIILDITERKKTKDRIEHLSRFPDENPDPVLRLGYDGTVLYANNSSRVLLDHWGCTEGEVLPVRYLPVVKDSIESGNRRELEVQYGDQFFHLTFTPILSEGYLNIYGRDITRRKKTEREFRDLFEKSGNAQLIIKNGKFVDCNQATVNLLKLGSKDDFLKVHPSEVSPEKQPDGKCSRVKADEMMNIALERGSHQFEWQHMRTDGREFPVEVLLTALSDPDGGALIHVVWIDIEERKQREAENNRLMAAIKQTVESIMITDRDGNIKYVNPAFEKMTGYSREEVLEKNPRLLKSGRQTDAFYAEMWNILLSGKTWSGRVENKKKDGSIYTEDATISPVRNADGRIINYVEIKSDITEELARENRYRQSQKMESVGRLAGGIAHDFNNILQTISGFCGLLLAEMDSDSPQRNDVHEIELAVEYAGNLTRQLLTFSRNRPHESSVINLGDVLSEAKNMFVQAVDGAAQLKFEMASGLKPVYADPTHIIQVVMNLIGNARDAMPEDGGVITLSTQIKNITSKDQTGRPNLEAGEYACIEVSDTGMGMSPEQQAHLFEPFYTTKQPGKGTGLGLSMVYGIVEESGGWVEVESALGEGSKFSVYLPVRPCAGQRGDEYCGKQPSAKQIMVLESSPKAAEMTVEFLLEAGYNAAAVGGFEEAMNILSTKDSLPDLLICAEELPDGDGLKLAEYGAGHCPMMKILLLAGESVDADRLFWLKDRDVHCLKKPFSLKELWSRVLFILSVSNRGVLEKE